MALFGPKKKDIFAEKEKIVPQQSMETAKEPQMRQERVEPKVKIDEGKVKTPVNSALITECMETKGDMSGCGSLIMKGAHQGNLLMEDTIIISREGSVEGKMRARNIKISGEVMGIIECETLEITKEARVEGEMYADNSYIDGEVSGEIYSDTLIDVNSNGKLTLKECKSKTIKVLGRLSGKVVASEMLEVIKGGSIEGEIVTKGIKTLDGGSVVGTIVTYDEKIHSDKPEKGSGEQPKEFKKRDRNDETQKQLQEDVAELIDVRQIDVNKYAPKKGE